MVTSRVQKNPLARVQDVEQEGEITYNLHMVGLWRITVENSV